VNDVLRIVSASSALDTRLARAARRIARAFDVEHAHVDVGPEGGSSGASGKASRTTAFPSTLTVPVMAGKDRVGRLVIATRHVRRFTADEVRLARAVGRQLGVAVTSARLNRQLLHSAAEWERTLDSIRDPMAVFDESHRARRVNAAMAEFAGSSIGHARGRTCCDLGLCGGGFPDCIVGSALAGQRPVERQVTTPDGREFVASATPILDAAGEVLLLAREVTEEHAAARRLREMSTELARTNDELRSTVDQLHSTQAQLVQAGKLSALGQLVAGVAHELNNPLTSVMGYAQLMQQQLRKQLDPSRRMDQLLQDVAQVVAESDRAARIVRNLLLFARRQTFARAAHDLTFLCAQVLDLRAYDMRIKNIEVSTDFADDLPPVFVDPSQIQQALLNLVLNAEQAMASSPQRRLEVAAVAEPECGSLRIEIRDTGHGIAPSDLERVFDPFFTTRAVGEGTGLGLSIVFGIIRDHGGQIWVESRPGEGTSFFVRLPAAPTSGVEGRPVRIFVANGDPGLRDFLHAVFTGWGFDVAQLRNAREAAEQLPAAGPCVVVVDRAGVEPNPEPWWEAWAGRAPGSVMVAMLAGSEDPRTERFLREESRVVVMPTTDLCQLRRALGAATGALRRQDAG